VTDLKRARVALRLSQSALARLAGVPRVHVCLHELGDRPLNAQEESRIEAAIRQETERLQKAARTILAADDHEA